MNTRQLRAAGLLLLGLSSLAFAGVSAPEIDPGSASGALALIGAAVLVIRSRRKPN
jgi:hypothetical protein